MTVPRHDAKFSDEVLDVLRRILLDEARPVAGPIVDPFAGVGRLAEVGRKDIRGIELEPEWSSSARWIRQGNALDRRAYPRKVGAVVSSPCYGNRFADQYLGPLCPECDGVGLVSSTGSAKLVDMACPVCADSGRDGRGRYGYAISLGRKVSEGSAASLQWGPKYRVFHLQWLGVIAEKLEPGPRRLVLNMSDHYRGKEGRAYVCDWWVSAARRFGFRLVEAYTADTDRNGHGQNHERRAESEMVFVFDLGSRSDPE